MTHALIKHRVSDYETWKKVFDDFAETRRAGGEQSFRILRTPTDPNDLTILFEWDNPENAAKFFASDDLRQAMQRAGVKDKPTIELLNQVDKGTP